MKRTHLGKIIGLLALLFASVFGQTIEGLIQQGSPYNAAMGYGLLLALANVILVSAIMMAVPFICRLIKKEKLDYKNGKRLCLWNSIILFVLSSISLVITEIGFIGGIGAIVYYFVNRWVFVKDKEHILTPKDSPLEDPIKTIPATVLDNTAETEKTKEKPTKTKPPVKYCSRCGSPIDPVSKKCTGCGKQYFKGISLKAFLIGFLIFCLVLSLVANILLFVKLQKKQEEVKQQDQENFYEWLDRQDQQEKADFMDEYIVLVEDDNTNLYHKFECSRFAGESFLALNIDAAIIDGFKPCPLCID